MLAQRGGAAEAGFEGHQVHRLVRLLQKPLRQRDALVGKPVAETGAGGFLETAREGAAGETRCFGDAVETVRFAERCPHVIEGLGEPVGVWRWRKRALDELCLAALPVR
ncbi:MAG: hypothetical protein E5V95_09220 [Mesorhizobium sp.]|nr:MAG: hypothetical protein E5V95_09220 [Mesorhizobium sp.]